MSPASELRITRGPNRFELMLGLFANKSLSFTIERRAVSALVLSATSVDSQRDRWHLSLLIDGQVSRWEYDSHLRAGLTLNELAPARPRVSSMKKGRALSVPTQMQLMTAMHDGSSLTLRIVELETMLTVQSLTAEDGSRTVWFATLRINGRDSRWYINTSARIAHEMVTA
jgi:hypothetical protein